MYPRCVQYMLSSHGQNTEECIMNAEMITTIVQQTALVMVAIALLYGIQKMINDFNDDQEGAIKSARSLRRQAYRQSLEVLSGLNPESICPATSQSSRSVKGGSMDRKSADTYPGIQSSRCPLKDLAAEASLNPAILAANLKLGVRDQELYEGKELLSC